MDLLPPVSSAGLRRREGARPTSARALEEGVRTRQGHGEGASGQPAASLFGWHSKGAQGERRATLTAFSRADLAGARRELRAAGAKKSSSNRWRESGEAPGGGGTVDCMVALVSPEEDADLPRPLGRLRDCERALRWPAAAGSNFSTD